MCRARVAELLEKDQEREEDAHYVVQAVQVLKSEMKEKERVAKKDHRKVKVRLHKKCKSLFTTGLCYESEI